MQCPTAPRTKRRGTLHTRGPCAEHTEGEQLDLARETTSFKRLSPQNGARIAIVQRSRASVPVRCSSRLYIKPTTSDFRERRETGKLTSVYAQPLSSTDTNPDCRGGACTLARARARARTRFTTNANRNHTAQHAKNVITPRKVTCSAPTEQVRNGATRHLEPHQRHSGPRCNTGCCSTRGKGAHRFRQQRQNQQGALRAHL